MLMFLPHAYMPEITTTQSQILLSLEIYSKFFSECVELWTQSKCEVSEKDNTTTKKVHQHWFVIVLKCFFLIAEELFKRIIEPKSQPAEER